jgi:hypothetical protein
MRVNIARKLNLPLCGPGFGNDVTFVDEFHYDAGGIQQLCDHFEEGIAAVI